MILTDEDTRKVRHIEDQGKELDKQIEQKRDAKAMKEC